MPSGAIVVDYLMRDESTRGFRFLEGAALKDGSLVVRYESGLLRVDDRGRTAWHRLHEDLSARMTIATDEEIVLESQAWYPDRVPPLTRYRTSDGTDL
jgi:hypothetical protein